MEEKVLKTGTTTVGIACKEGIVLAADKKMTMGGMIIATTKFDKIITINEDLAITIAGNVSDVQLLVKLLKAQVKLDELRRNKKLKTKEIANFLASVAYGNARQYFPALAGFLLGGRDNEGTHLYALEPDGAITEYDDYTADGSGMMYALGVLEANWKKDMSIDEAVKLAFKAVSSSMQRDTASGGGMDIVTITKDGVKKVFTKQLDTKLTM